MGKISVLSHQDTQDVDIPVGRQINCGGSTDTAPMATQTPNFFDLQESHRAAGDTANRHEVFADGYTKWGPGNAGPDTWLYRDAATSLRTNGALKADGPVTARGGVECANVGDFPGALRCQTLASGGITFNSSTATTVTPFAFTLAAGIDYELFGLLHVVCPAANDAKFELQAGTMSNFAFQVIGGGTTDTAFATAGSVDKAILLTRGTTGGQDVFVLTARLRPSAATTVNLRVGLAAGSGSGALGVQSYLKCTRLS